MTVRAIPRVVAALLLAAGLAGFATLPASADGDVNDDGVLAGAEIDTWIADELTAWRTDSSAATEPPAESDAGPAAESLGIERWGWPEDWPPGRLLDTQCGGSPGSYACDGNWGFGDWPEPLVRLVIKSTMIRIVDAGTLVGRMGACDPARATISCTLVVRRGTTDATYVLEWAPGTALFVATTWTTV